MGKFALFSFILTALSISHDPIQIDKSEAAVQPGRAFGRANNEDQRTIPRLGKLDARPDRQRGNPAPTVGSQRIDTHDRGGGWVDADARATGHGKFVADEKVHLLAEDHV